MLNVPSADARCKIHVFAADFSDCMRYELGYALILSVNSISSAYSKFQCQSSTRVAFSFLVR
jgi:hypothetical protein